jgi:hypothetical protein
LFGLGDPKRNAGLDPREWAAAARLGRLRLAAALAVAASALLGAAAFVWYPVDRTRDLAPEAVVERAGLEILQAGHYRFHAEVTGKAGEYPFPDTKLDGEYQKEPQMLHLTGRVLSGESEVPLEYWLEGSQFYLRHPTLQQWLKVTGMVPEELTSFYPENLAAPLVGGVRGVEEIGRERLPGGQAVQYRLDLDPAVMLPGNPELRQDRVEYRLWVYTRTLRPARFSVRVSHAGASDNRLQSNRFSYELSWDFGGAGKLAVPAAVAKAEEVGAVPAVPGNSDGTAVEP